MLDIRHKEVKLMHVPTLIIGNIDGESQVGEPEKRTDREKRESSIVANRLVWLSEPGDILLLPFEIDRNFLNYSLRLRGHAPDSVRVITPSSHPGEVCILTYATLSDVTLIQELLHAMESSPRWSVIPYFFDRAVANLMIKLTGFTNVIAPGLAFFREGGAEVLNSKIEFRRIAEAYKIPVARGHNCYSVDELIWAVEELLPETDSVIIKQDLNAGGDGNVVVSRTPRSEALGSRRSMVLRGDHDLKNLWTSMRGSRNVALVVEAYHEVFNVFYSEFEIPRPSESPHLLNYGDMRMEPTWNGFQIPPETLSLQNAGEFIVASALLAVVAQQRGYTGKINIDGILTNEGRVLITEINGRLGGCTHLHQIAESLYGMNYASRFAIVTRNDCRPATRDFNELFYLLDARGMLVHQSGQEGMIIVTEDLSHSGTIEYMVVARGFERAHQLEELCVRIAEGVE